MFFGMDAETWSDSFEEFFTKGEIYAVSGSYFLFGGLSYWYFIENSAYAIYYYDEVLQERLEEEIQFGAPEKQEDDIPEEFTMDD